MRRSEKPLSKWVLYIVLLIGYAALACCYIWAPPGNEQNWLFGWFFKSTDNLGTIIAYSFVGLSVGFAAYQWIEEKKWKRRQAVQESIAAFNETPGSRNALLMLTWRDREIPLWDATNPNRHVRVTREEVIVALLPDILIAHAEFTDDFKRRRTAIRDSFEDLVGRLSHILIYFDGTKNSVLSKEDVIQIMPHQVSDFTEFCKVDPDPELLYAFKLYIRWRKMESVEELFKCLGDTYLEQDLEKHKDEEDLLRKLRFGSWGSFQFKREDFAVLLPEPPKTPQLTASSP